MTWLEGIALLLAFSTRNVSSMVVSSEFENLPRLCASLTEGIFLQGLVRGGGYLSPWCCCRQSQRPKMPRRWVHIIRLEAHCG